MSRMRKRRHKDPSSIRAPSVGLVILVPHSDSPQRRLSNRLEPTSHEFRLAAKFGVVDSIQYQRNICVLTINMSTNMPTVNVRFI